MIIFNPHDRFSLSFLMLSHHPIIPILTLQATLNAPAQVLDLSARTSPLVTLPRPPLSLVPLPVPPRALESVPRMVPVSVLRVDRAGTTLPTPRARA